MRFIYILLFINCFVAKGFSIENYDVNLIPKHLLNRANSCIRNEERIVDMQAMDNVITTVKKAITVFNQNGSDVAGLIIFYDKSVSIKSIKGEIYNASGILIGKFNQNNFTDASAADGFSLFIDSRVKRYLPSINQFPYTVVYNYEIRNKQNLIIEDWVPKPQNDISVEKSNYTFITKPNDEIRVNAKNMSAKAEEIITDKQKKWVWHVNNLLAVRSEPFSPDRETYEISVKIAPKQFNYYGYKGSYTNWQDLGAWVYNDLLKNRSNLSTETIAQIKALTKNELTDKDKARKIYQYLQDKTRYISVQIGIGGFQPISASEVDRLGYGDCKALVNYMQSLLKAVDIESIYCVVEAGNFKKGVDPNYASMVQGNHIILCLPLKGDTTWLECTSQKSPFGYLGTFTDDRLVLACLPDGGKLLKTPKLTAQNNLQQRKSDLTIDDSGNITGTVNTVYSGSQYDNTEDVIGKPLIEQKKLLKEQYDIDNIDFKSVNYLQDKTSDPKTVENIVLSMRNYATMSDSKMFLQLNTFNTRKSIPEIKGRTLPVYLNRGYTDEDEITYTLPLTVQTTFIIPTIKTLKSLFGEYEAKTMLIGQKLTYYRKLVLFDGTFPAESYEAFAKFMNAVNDYDHLKISLNLK